METECVAYPAAADGATRLDRAPPLRYAPVADFSAAPANRAGPRRAGLPRCPADVYVQAPPVIHRLFLVLPAALLLSACGGGKQPAGVISRDKFVAANVAVRTLPDDATPERRAEALRKHGVTDRQLKAWVTVNARDPEVLAKAWEQIAFKLDSLGGVQSTPIPPPPAPGAAVPPPVRRPPLKGRPDSVRQQFPVPPPMDEARPELEPAPPGRRRPIRQVQ